MKNLANHWNYYSQEALILWSWLFDNFIDWINAITAKPFSLKVTLSNVFYSINNIQ